MKKGFARLAVMAIMFGTVALGASAQAAVPAATTASAADVKCEVHVTTYNVYEFTGNGVKIWSGPGNGTVKGHGQVGQPFCFDRTQGNWIHGTNRTTMITGWVHKSLLKPFVPK